MYCPDMVLKIKTSSKSEAKPQHTHQGHKRREAASINSAPEMNSFYLADTYSADQSVGYMIRRINSLLAQQVEREFEPCGLTNAQWLPLLKIYWGHATTVAELARGCELDAGSMTRLLDRLESKQLLRRVRSSDDRRVVNLELTDAGRDAASEIPHVLCKVQNEHLVGFSHAEWTTLVGFLGRILDTAQSRVVSDDRSLQPILDKTPDRK